VPSTRIRSRALRCSLASLLLATACGPESNPAEVHVPDPPVLTVAESVVTLAVVEGEADPEPVGIAVTNGGEAALTGLSSSVEYGEGHSDGWLTAALEASSAPTNLHFAAATAALHPGSYEATVQVHAQGAEDSPGTVAVSLSVEPGPEPPRFESSETRLVFDVAEGGPIPDAQVAQITNVGDLPLDQIQMDIVYLPESPSGWLSAALDSTTAPTSLTVSVDASGLAASSYRGRLQLEADGASNTLSIAVELVVRAPEPRIELQWDRREFIGYEGRDFVEPYGLAVRNGGQGTLGEVAVVVDYPSGQPTGWLTATPRQTEAPMHIGLEASVGSLTAGSYEALIIVSSPQASNRADTATAILRVEPPGPIIGVSKDHASFNARQHGASPPPKTIQITNVGEDVLTDLAIEDTHTESWLAASLDRTTAPAVLTLSVSAAGLPVDVHQTRLRITSPVAKNLYGQLEISVTFFVDAGLPDLVVEGDLVAPASVPAGDPLTLSELVAVNAGDGFATPHVAGVYLSADTTVTADDLLVEATSVRGTQPGEIGGLPGYFAIDEATPPGSYFLGVVLDTEDVVHESDEDNNFVSTPIEILPPITRYTLEVLDQGGDGWVDVSPYGVLFEEGTVVTLTAKASPAFRFEGWGGDLGGLENPVQLVMDGDKTVSAMFAPTPPELRGGRGMGFVSLTWSYQWSCRPDGSGRCTASPSDRFVLEESTTGDPDDFTVVHTMPSDRDIHGSVTLDRAVGVWHYRVRAEGDGFVSPWSDVLSVTVFDPGE